MATWRSPALLFRTDLVTSAIPLAHVVETLRPLPCAPLPGAPAFVDGIAVIRGIPTPVVNAAKLLGRDAGAPASRLILLRVGEAQVALAVDSVIGVEDLAAEALAALPPLFGDPAAFEAIGRLDGRLLLVLRAGRLVPDEVWTLLSQRSAQ